MDEQLKSELVGSLVQKILVALSENSLGEREWWWFYKISEVKNGFFERTVRR